MLRPIVVLALLAALLSVQVYSQQSTVLTTNSVPTIRTTPSTCTPDDTGNYPYGLCEPQYWSCREVGDGYYRFVLMNCTGDFVFNPDPDSPYCDDPQNVDSCVTVTTIPTTTT